MRKTTGVFLALQAVDFDSRRPPYDNVTAAMGPVMTEAGADDAVVAVAADPGLPRRPRRQSTTTTRWRCGGRSVGGSPGRRQSSDPNARRRCWSTPFLAGNASNDHPTGGPSITSSRRRAGRPQLWGCLGPHAPDQRVTLAGSHGEGAGVGGKPPRPAFDPAPSINVCGLRCQMAMDCHSSVVVVAIDLRPFEPLTADPYGDDRVDIPDKINTSSRSAVHRCGSGSWVVWRWGRTRASLRRRTRQCRSRPGCRSGGRRASFAAYWARTAGGLGRRARTAAMALWLIFWVLADDAAAAFHNARVVPPPPPPGPSIAPRPHTRRRRLFRQITFGLDPRALRRGRRRYRGRPSPSTSPPSCSPGPPPTTTAPPSSRPAATSCAGAPKRDRRAVLRDTDRYLVRAAAGGGGGRWVPFKRVGG
ncbi:putative mnng and nitrosoguanidine resistance protein [Rosellinia necatrix]|uniref:Putative mnng and nitrosoguanidine resistance protein n=1 Tax=Rosellinia necatrix TaxID=77044 RepID=A0A1S8A5M9_ROSNE|nr:putative mnng and nitrosoguanidine resistance protein [Rosellinia necatrix]